MDAQTTNGKPEIAKLLDYSAIDKLIKSARKKYKEGHFGQARSMLDKALSMGANRSLIMNERGIISLSAGNLQRSCNEFLASLRADVRNKTARRNHWAVKRLAGIKATPAIFFNSVPQSGTTFVSMKIAEALNVPRVTMHAGQYLPELVLDYARVESLIFGKAVGTAHIRPLEENLTIISHYLDKMVFNVRDPRQSTLSWIHKIDKMYSLQRYQWLDRMIPGLPKGYFVRSISEKLDWHLEHHLPHLVTLIEEWIEFDASKPFDLDILFLRHEDLAENSRCYFDKLLAFLDVPKHWFSVSTDRPGTSNKKLNFRKGSTSEWLSVFNSKQKDIARNRIPVNLLERFDWIREE